MKPCFPPTSGSRPVNQLQCPEVLPGPRGYARCSGFTLIELVISVALGAIILTSAYLCLRAGFTSQELLEPRIDTLQNGRVAMDLICADLRAACPFASGAEFVGFRRSLGEVDGDNLDFATRNHTPRGANQGDYCEQSYYLERNSKTGTISLMRRRNPRLGFDPFSGGTREEIAADVAGFRLEYYDGFEWFDSWGESNPALLTPSGSPPASAARTILPPNATGLPEAVRVTLRLNANPRKDDKSERPLVFQSIARIVVPFRGGGSSSSGGSSGSSSSSATAPSAGPTSGPTRRP